MLTTLADFYADYKKNGIRTSIEISQKDYFKLFALVVGIAIAIMLSRQLINGIFSKS
jgi:hypothetical protein